jgi:hypothetical protein
MDDFRKYSDGWIRRCKEVWFQEPTDPLCFYHGAENYPEFAEWYDLAMDVFHVMENIIKMQREELEAMKAAADRRAAEKAAGIEPPSQPLATGDEDYFGVEGAR